MAKEKEGEVEEEHSLLSPFSLSGLEGEIDKGKVWMEGRDFGAPRKHLT